MPFQDKSRLLSDSQNPQRVLYIDDDDDDIGRFDRLLRYIETVKEFAMFFTDVRVARDTTATATAATIDGRRSTGRANER